MKAKTIVSLALAIAFSTPLAAQKTVPAPVAPALTYADVADLALPAPVVAQVRIKSAEYLKGPLAGNVVAPKRRYLVTADLIALIRGSNGLPPRITYVVDLAPDALGRFTKLPKAEMVIFGLTVPGRPTEIRLTAPDAQQPATPALTALLRNLLNAAGTPGAPPQIRSVGDAHHSAGAIPGEGETQIFLNAADGRPLSLSVWRTPDAAPRWAVSVGEIVDQGAEPPARDTLLWYRLACTLPRRLPASSADTLDPADATIVAEDYATVIAGLGPCQRSRGKQSPA